MDGAGVKAGSPCLFACRLGGDGPRMCLFATLHHHTSKSDGDVCATSLSLSKDICIYIYIKKDER